MSAHYCFYHEFIRAKVFLHIIGGRKFIVVEVEVTENLSSPKLESFTNYRRRTFIVAEIEVTVNLSS